MYQRDLLTKYLFSPRLATLLIAVLLSFSSQAQLVINEIMFNDGSSNEFVEIYNTSGSNVSLTGWSLEVDGNSRSLTGTIRANDYLLVYHSSSAKAADYFTYSQELGYTFFELISNTLPSNLDNSSSTLELYNGAVLEDAVTYLSSWDGSSASGTGKSLELNDAGNDNSLSSNWAASGFDDGSYGGQNAAVSCYTSTCNSALSNLSSGVDLIQISGSQSISQNLSIDELIINSGATVELKPTQNTGHHFQLTSTIDNDGTFTVGNNCTVLQTTTSANTGSGTYNIERLGDNDNGMHNIWGAAVTNANITTTFDAANPCDIYTYNASNQRFLYDFSLPFSTTCNGNSVNFSTSHMITDAGSTADGIFDIGRGYFSPGDNTLTLRTFSGDNLNNGTITEPIVINGTGATDNDDWNLISNPYCSGVDAEAFVNANTNIQAALYFWNPSSSGGVADGDYKVWTTLGSIGNTLNGGEITGALSGNHIAGSQGFFIEANAGGTVEFNNTMRTNTSNQFFKSDNSDDIERIWVSLSSEDNQLNKQILVGLTNDASLSKDRMYDARAIEGNPKLSFYSILNSENMSIQGQPKLTPSEERILPVGFNSQYPGVHSFKIDTTINWNSSVDVFLYDHLKQSSFDLNSGQYFFYSDTGRINDRFSLILKNSISTSVDENTPLLTTLKTVSLDNQWMIESLGSDILEYQVIDVAGKLLVNKKITNKKLTIDNSSYVSGLYFVKVKFANNEEKVLKLIRQ